MVLVRDGKGAGVVARLPEAGDYLAYRRIARAGEGRVEGGLGPVAPYSAGDHLPGRPVALLQEALDVGVALGDLGARGRDPVLGVVEEVGLALVAVHDDVGDAELDADLGDAREGVAEDPGERLVVDVVRRVDGARSRRSRPARRGPARRRRCGCRRPSGRRRRPRRWRGCRECPGSRCWGGSWRRRPGTAPPGRRTTGIASGGQTTGSPASQSAGHPRVAPSRTPGDRSRITLRA